MGLFSKINRLRKKIWRGVKKVATKAWDNKAVRAVVIAAATVVGGAALGAMASGSGFGGFVAAMKSPTMALKGYGHAAKAAADITGLTATAGDVTRGLKAGYTGQAAPGAGAATKAAAGAGPYAEMAGAAHGGAAAASPGGGLLAGIGRGLGHASRWAAANPMATATLAKGVGTMLSPSPQEEAFAMRERERDQARASTASVGFPVFNPSTGRIESVPREEYIRRRGMA